ncbi:MAG: Ig-like domain-containing protein [Verrucomicrobiota bacterium]
MPVVTAIPPKGNLLLWLAADTNALTFGSGDLANSVYEWDDMSGTAHNAMPPNNGAEALPILGAAPFPNAVHPVLHFYGNNALQPVNSPDFYVQNFTVYLVGSVDNTKASRDWIGSWEGWCLGTSDGSAGVIKWVTHTTAGDFSMEPAASFMPFMVPAFIAGTFSNPGNKTLAVNGAVLGVQSNTAPINYSTDRGVAIGSLFFDSLTQPLVGDIAEILIYTNVSAAQDAGVQAYIASKYFTPSTVAPKLSSASSSAAQNTTVRVVFSGNVSATTAGNPANYAIDHGVSVSAATVVNGTTVNLTTSVLNSGPVYNLTVNGVADWAGNALAANSKIAVSGIPVLLDIQKQGTAISIKWDAPGWKLQSSGPLGGSWSNVTGASSPYPVTPTGTPTFYRLSE